MSRDTGRTACYAAENELGERPQLGWTALMEFARRVVTDPVVQGAYPALGARMLRLRPVMAARSTYVGRYCPTAHRIELCYGGRDDLTLLHELAHASTPHEKHGSAWRQAYCVLAHRVLDAETALRLTAAMVNHAAIPSTAKGQ